MVVGALMIVFVGLVALVVVRLRLFVVVFAVEGV